MDTTLFNTVLKKEALNCYHCAIDSYYNHPFINDKARIKDDIIEFEINQSLGKKAYKSVMDSKLSDVQIKILDKLVMSYKNRVIKALSKEFK